MARNLTNETLLGLVSPRIGGIELVFLQNNLSTKFCIYKKTKIATMKVFFSEQTSLHT
jgi:hypothetical protein